MTKKISEWGFALTLGVMGGVILFLLSTFIAAVRLQ